VLQHHLPGVFPAAGALSDAPFHGGCPARGISVAREALEKIIISASVGIHGVDFNGFFVGMMLLGKSEHLQVWPFFKTVFLCQVRHFLVPVKDTLKKSSFPRRRESRVLILLGFDFGKHDFSE
jgi:hypothetical protein